MYVWHDGKFRNPFCSQLTCFSECDLASLMTTAFALNNIVVRYHDSCLMQLFGMQHHYRRLTHNLKQKKIKINLS